MAEVHAAPERSYSPERLTANILGALSQLILDRVQSTWQEALDLSPMAAATLSQIEWDPGCSIETVAQRNGLSHSATVRIVDRLAERDLLTKDRARKDGRQQSLKLTKAGLRAVQQLHCVRNQVTDGLLAALAPAQRASFGEAVRTMLVAAVNTAEEGYITCRVCDDRRCADICPIQLF